MTTETCRDVLAAMLAAASNMSDLADALDFYGFSADRIRAAIAADDAERERLRARPLSEWHEDHGEALWWRFPVDEAPYVGDPSDDDWPGYHTHWTPIVVPDEPPTPLMRQIHEAQRIAGEMPELRRRHARMAVDGGRDDG